MPGFVIFGRRWSVASDDFVVPGVTLLCIHLVWLIVLVSVVAIVNLEDGTPCLKSLWEHVIGYIAILSGCVIIEACITMVAMRGTILDPSPRASMKYLLYVRLAILCIELAWVIVGVMWLTEHYKTCASTVAKDALLGIVICNWCVMFSMFLSIWCTFDPAGRSWVKMKRYQQAMLGRSRHNHKMRSGSFQRNWRHRKVMRAYQDSWDHRCRLLFCCMGNSEGSKNTFGDIAKLFSEFFRDLDVVPSDVIAGFVLLRKFQGLERQLIVKQKLNSTYEYLSGVPVSHDTEFLALNDPAVLEEYQNIIHYMRFALGVYGWPMYLISNSSCSACYLCPYLRCCLGCDGEQGPVITEDNCCGCNYAALRKTCEFQDMTVIYATFHVDVEQTPFFVALDHNKRTIVICIRGTLSMQDIMTDLTAEGEHIPTNIVNEEWVGHKGIVRTAVYVRDKLKSDKILSKARDYDIPRGTQNYQVVLVGHSLGAGTAAILAILLKEDFADLKCYAYSPPGGLLSMPAVNYTKDFITSVVVGKDVVPRIGLAQMEALRADLINAIQRSKDPKWKTITGSLPCCGKYTEDEQSECVQEFFKNKDKLRSTATSLSNSKITLTMHEALYPPGRILHVVRHHPKKGQRKYNSKWEKLVKNKDPIYQALWVDNTSLDEVLISPVMIQDHMPDYVLEALEKVLINNGPRKPQRLQLTENLESENSKLLHQSGSFSPGFSKTPPPHKLCMETCFTSTPSLDTGKTSFETIIKKGTVLSPSVDLSSEFFSLINEEINSPIGRSTIKLESLLDVNGYRTRKVDLIYDDWIGLAPVASPETLSDISSVSSRKSVLLNPNETSLKRLSLERRLHKSASVIDSQDDSMISNLSDRHVQSGISTTNLCYFLPSNDLPHRARARNPEEKPRWSSMKPVQCLLLAPHVSVTKDSSCEQSLENTLDDTVSNASRDCIDYSDTTKLYGPSGHRTCSSFLTPGMKSQLSKDSGFAEKNSANIISSGSKHLHELNYPYSTDAQNCNTEYPSESIYCYATSTRNHSPASDPGISENARESCDAKTQVYTPYSSPNLQKHSTDTQILNINCLQSSTGLLCSPIKESCL